MALVTVTPAPTVTNTPHSPTTTPVATNTPVASATAPSSAIEPYPDAPPCPDHDDRAWHSLWDAQRGCYYTHHHGDDPHSVDDLFGTALFEYAGGEISYPWQTYSDAGTENALKHEGYLWHVRRDMPCENSNPCIEAFRVQVHQHSQMDSHVRYHSYVFEALMSDGAYVLFPGHADFGDLHVPEGTIIIDEPCNTDSYDPNTNNPGRHRQHRPPPETGMGSSSMIWYGASQRSLDCGPRGFVTISTSIQDSWVYTDPNDPARFDAWVCYPNPRCRANATTLRAHLIAFEGIDTWPFIYNANGVADWSGYADRHGILQEESDCTGISVDCIPVILRGIQRGHRYMAANSHTASDYRDYDIYFGRFPSGWAQPPYTP